MPPFTFQQVDVNLIEFRALPGPEARALRAKIMRQHSFSGLGGQAVLSPGKGLFRCRGARPGARWARLPKLRIVDCGMRIEKENRKNLKSEIRNPKYLGRCFFRATPFLPGHKLAFSKKRTKVKRGKVYFSLEKSNFASASSFLREEMSFFD